MPIVTWWLTNKNSLRIASYLDLGAELPKGLS